MFVARAAAFALAFVACSSELPPSGDDAGNNVGPVDAKADARKLMWVDASGGGGNNLPCKPPATPPSVGQHNPGKSCFQTCHNHGFTLAGTLYTNATGNTAFAGATITITDSNNVTFDLVTHQNGNFYTNRAIAFPVLTLASSCPSAVQMNSPAGNGNCNSCHAGGTNDQMYLQ